MDEGVLRRIFLELSTVSSDETPLEIIWHGGEPTLAGIDFYRMAVDMQREIFPNKEVKNGIQTNGTLINDDWCRFFQEVGFRPSVSMDGPKDLHDKLRVNSANRGTYEKVISGYRLMKAYGLHVGSLGVITSYNVRHPEMIINWLIENNITSWDFLFATETPEADSGLNPELKEAEDFSIRLFDYWFDKDNPDIKIRTFRTMLKSLVGGSPSICSWKSGCLTFISFDIDGNAYLCAKFHVYPETSYGNIMEKSLNDMIENPRVKTMHREIVEAQKSCSDCRWLRGCGGGCSFIKYAFHKKFNAPFEHCGIRSSLFEHIERAVKRFV